MTHVPVSYFEELANGHIRDYNDSLPEARAEWEDPVRAKRYSTFSLTMVSDIPKGPTYQLAWDVKLPHRPALGKLSSSVTGLDQACTALRNRGSSVTKFERALESMTDTVRKLRYTSHETATSTRVPLKDERPAIKHSK